MRLLADKRHRGAVALVAALLLGVATVSAVFGGIVGAPFEYGDGNPTRNSTTDWNDLTSGMGGASAVTSGQLGAVIFDNNYTVERTLFTGGGSKDINDVDQWAWRSVGQAPDKTDLLHAGAALYENVYAGDDYLYFMADRYATNGDAKIGFWFFREPVTLVNDPSTDTFGTFDGNHSTGDVLIEATFTNGGTAPSVNVYEWTTGGLTRRGDMGGYACDINSPAFVVACGKTNSGPYSPSWVWGGKFNGSRPDGAFFEGAVNLDELFPAGTPCFSSFLAETRSAASSTSSELKDFILGSFDTCGSITIRKYRLGGTTGDSWDFTSATLGNFSLNGATGGTSSSDATYVEDETKETFSQKLPGQYVVTETTAGMGWTLADITCTGGTTTKDVSNRKVTIDLTAGADVVCTFVNAQGPQLKVTKVLSPADDPGSFNLLVDGLVVKPSATTGDPSSAWLDRSTGVHTVSEDTNGTGTEISAYTTTIACYDRANGDAPVTATPTTGDRIWNVTLAYGQRVECEITNSRTPEAFTRTQGYWQTHPDMVYYTWKGGEEGYNRGPLLTDFGCSLQPQTSQSPGADEVLGGFWANVSYTSDEDENQSRRGEKRRMTLLQQLLAAILNVAYFGPANDSIVGQIEDAQDAFCGGDPADVSTSAGLMGMYNESGDYGGVIDQNTHADPDEARDRADVEFWDFVK